MEFFGRKTEIEKLGRAFSRIRKGEGRMALVTGPPGVGKSALVHRFALDAEAAGGLYAFGKADLNRLATPFGAVGPALDMIVKKMIAESSEQAADLARQVQDRMGDDMGRVLALTPSLSFVLPDTEKPRGDGSGLSASSLIYTLLELFTRQSRGLVLFLDDIQWLDTAAMKLLTHLTVAPPIPGLLTVLGVRGVKYSTAPGMADLEKGVRETDGTLFLPLKGLSGRDVAAFLKHRLETGQKMADLAALCLEKTHGNPLYLNRFIEDLLASGDLSRHVDGWQWATDKIRSRGFSENVIDLIVSRIRNIPENCLTLLKYGALIQGDLNMEELASITGLTAEEVSLLLLSPLKSNLLEMKKDLCGFTHDRVREAVWGIIEKAEAKEIHFRLTVHYMAAVRKGADRQRLFSMLHHFERCSGMGFSPEETGEMARYYLAAGRQALRQATYDQALTWYLAGMALLGEPVLGDDTAVAWQMCRYGAECAYLTGAFDTADRLFREAGAYAPDPDARFEMEMVRFASFQARDHHETVLSLGRQILRQLGHPLPERISGLKLVWMILRLWRRLAVGKQGASLTPAEDGRPDARVLKVLLPLGPSAIYLNRKDLFLFSVARGFEISLQWGDSKESPMFYLSFGLVLNRMTGSIARGRGFARRLAATAREIRARYPDENLRAKEMYIAASFLEHCYRPMPRLLANYEEGMRMCRKQGDHVYYAYYAITLLHCRLLAGAALKSVLSEAKEILSMLRRMKNASGIQVVSLLVQMIDGLCTGTQAPFDPGVAQENAPPGIGEDPRLTTNRTYLLWHRICFAFFSGRTDLAHPIIPETSKQWDGYLIYNYIRFIAALIEIDAGKSRKRARKGLKIVLRYARENPSFYRGRCLLAKGEFARVWGRPSRALGFYLQAEAIFETEPDGFFEKGYLKEKAALVYTLLGDDEAARKVRAQAIACFRKWGLGRREGLFEAAEPELASEAEERSHGACETAGGVGKEQAALFAISEKTRAAEVHAVVRDAACWKSLMVVEKGRLHRPATVLPLPDRMLTFAVTTGQVVTATKKDAAEQFFDTAFVFERRPEALVVLPAGDRAAVLIVDPGREADTAALERLALPVSDWLALNIPNPASADEGQVDEAHRLMTICRMLQAYMARKRVYRNPKLDLKQLADELNIHRRTITSALNVCLNQNLNTFINSYRIEEIKEQMMLPENKNKTIIEIAFAAGFNSKSTFNQTFRRQTGMTPSEYRAVQYTSWHA